MHERPLAMWTAKPLRDPLRTPAPPPPKLNISATHLLNAGGLLPTASPRVGISMGPLSITARPWPAAHRRSITLRALIVEAAQAASPRVPLGSTRSFGSQNAGEGHDWRQKAQPHVRFDRKGKPHPASPRLSLLLRVQAIRCLMPSNKNA